MEVQALKLLLTEADLSQFAIKAAEQNDQVSDLQVRITPEAVVVSGVYQMLMRMPFETFWQVAVREGKLAVTLSDLKVVGFGASLLKGVLMRMLTDEAEKIESIRIEGETVLFDPDQVLAKNGLTGHAHLRLVRLERGALVVEAGMVTPNASPAGP